MKKAQFKLTEAKESIVAEEKERFCYEGGRHTFIFTTKNNLRLLCESDEVFGDSTFEYAPKYYLQLYTIHVLKNGYYVQVAYCFLPNKDIATYTNMWLDLIHLCTTLVNKELKIKNFVADFEIAAHISVFNIFQCKIRCCRFHLGQNF